MLEVEELPKKITLRRELLVEKDQAGVDLIGVALLNEG